ncbi:MAG: VOC family protein [Micromonosporaceae bacterium]
MATKIYVNLPVKDLSRTRDFWSKVGFTFNELFSDENAAGMVIDDEAGIYAMLLTEEFFQSFHKSAVADPSQQREVIVALGLDSRQQVDELADNALAAGGQAVSEPKDEGFMYSRGFYDVDGHHWAVHWMDPSAVPPA